MSYLKSPREGSPGDAHPPPRRARIRVVPWSNRFLPQRQQQDEEQGTATAAAAAPASLLRAVTTQPAVEGGTGMSCTEVLREGFPSGKYPPTRWDGGGLVLPWDGCWPSAMLVNSSTGAGGGETTTAPSVERDGWRDEVATRQPIGESQPRARRSELEDKDQWTLVELPSPSIRWANENETRTNTA